MNIFVLDECPIQSAKWHVDKHCVKMILESAQLLCSVYHFQFPDGSINIPYKKTHMNHPCSIWVRESLNNYMWVLKYAYALTKEYTERYNKHHKSSLVIDWCFANMENLKFDNIESTPHALAMPDEYKVSDPIQSYRNYYKFGKSHLHSWIQNKPYWID